MKSNASYDINKHKDELAAIHSKYSGEIKMLNQKLERYGIVITLDPEKRKRCYEISLKIEIG